MIRNYENSKWFKWSMNALLLISFPAFLWFIKWADSDSINNWYLPFFIITCGPMMYSLFYNIKYSKEIINLWDGKRLGIWFRLLFFILFYIVFCFMWAFTYYIDSWYLITVPIASILGIYATIRYIKSGKI